MNEDLKKEFGERVKSLRLGFSGSQFDFLWEFLETAITKARLDSRRKTIEQFVSGDIKAPQIERYIEATMKNIITKAVDKETERCIKIVSEYEMKAFPFRTGRPMLPLVKEMFELLSQKKP